MALLYSLSFLYVCCMIHLVVLKNKTVYTYGDGGGIVVIVVSIYHLLYEYLDCSVKLIEEFVLQFQGASILSTTSTS